MGLENRNYGLEEIIKIWKDQKISHVDVEFNCGGDSMGEVNPEFYVIDEKGNEVLMGNEILDGIWEYYLEAEMYNQVDFYVNSDGHYQGEFGIVQITLSGSAEHGEKENFLCTKSATAEYNESLDIQVTIPFNKEQIEFLEEYIEKIEFSFSDPIAMVTGGERESFIFYKKDFLMTDAIAEKTEDIYETVSEYIYQNYEIEAEKNQYRLITDPDSTVELREFEDSVDVVVEKNSLTGEFEAIFSVEYFLTRTDNE